MTGAKVVKLEKGKDTVTCHVDVGGRKIEKITVDRVISAVGIVAGYRRYRLDQTKVKTDKGRIVTGHILETDEVGVYAIGDVAGAPWLVHKSSHWLDVCAEKLAGLKKMFIRFKGQIPGCTYAYPQVVSGWFN